MKKFILFPCVGILLYLALTSYSTGPGATAGLQLAGVGGGAGCGATGGCHSTSASASTGITIQLYSGASPVTTYTGGGSYTIRITGTQTSTTSTLPRFGFQCAVVKTSTTTSEGTLSAATGTHTVTAAGVRLVEHSSPIAATTGSGGAGTTYVVNIPWTAPVAGTGSVTVYTVLNAVNFDGVADAADLWNNTTLVIPESVVTAPVTGTLHVCIGSTTTLADATTGGTWSSGTTGVATVGATTGVVTGVTAGTAVITYTSGTGTATATVTVNALPAAIGGVTFICPGATATFTDITTGGTWSGSTPSVASLGSGTGVVIGITGGTSVITYTLPTGCTISTTLTVETTTPITGLTAVCTGATITLGNATTGGTWTSGTPAVATIGSTSAVVTGVMAGTDVIHYALPTGCTVTETITVNTVPGTISGPAIVCVGTTIPLTGIAGGIWSTTNAHASVGTGTGIVSGLSVGTDTIKYTVTNSCGRGTATHTVAVHAAGTCSAGVDPVAASPASGLQIYPNPARAGNFTLNLTADMDDEAHIVITNIAGVRIKEFTASANQAVDVQMGAVPGIYILQAETAHEKYVVKVVVE